MAENKMICIIGEKDFDIQVINAPYPVIVDFFQDWCPPCIQLEEVMKKEIVDSKGWKIVRINLDEPDNSDLSSNLNVQGVPCIFLYYQGQQLSMFYGFKKDKFLEMIKKCNELLAAKKK